MAISDLYNSPHEREFTHFSSLVNVAMVDGEINAEEEIVLKRLAEKLNISEAEYNKAVKNPNAFPVNPPNSNMERLERLYDVLSIIFADHVMDKKEAFLLKKYAVALGYSSRDSEEVIQHSVKILSGELSFEDYLYLLRRYQPKAITEE